MISCGAVACSMCVWILHLLPSPTASGAGSELRGWLSIMQSPSGTLKRFKWANGPNRNLPWDEEDNTCHNGHSSALKCSEECANSSALRASRHCLKAQRATAPPTTQSWPILDQTRTIWRERSEHSRHQPQGHSPFQRHIPHSSNPHGSRLRVTHM